MWKLPRVAATGAWLLGPAAWATVARARFGDPRQAERAWARRASKLLGIRFHISGLDNIDPSERYLVAPLHEGFADAIALLQLPLSMRFVARTELLDWAVLGAALRAGGHVAVDPERPVSAYRDLIRVSESITDSLVVFPQGTILGIESAFSPGAFHLARSLGRPLLPIAITGSHRIWEHPFSPAVRFGQSVHLQVLPAVPSERAALDMREIERSLKRRALLSTIQPRRYEPDRDGWWDDYRFDIDSDFEELAERVAVHRRRIAGSRSDEE